MAVEANDLTSSNEVQPARQRASRLTVLAIIALCAAPVIASYVAYYLYPPEGRSVYGTLIDPQVEMSDLGGIPVAAPAGDGAAPVAGAQRAQTTFAALRGQWVMVVAAAGVCPGDCPERLYALRQVRLAQGRDAERIERVWLVTDAKQPAASLLAEHPGLQAWFVAPDQLLQRLPAGTREEGSARIYLIDPHGQLMMQFPIGADAGRIRKDLARLLKISRIG